MRIGTEAEISHGIELHLCLIRHGMTKANAERRYLGKTDEGLSDLGIRALQIQKEQKRFPQPDILLSSPMLRCRQTAELLFPELKYECIPEWTEIDFGIFEGKNHAELDGNEAYQKWIDSGGALPFPGGESREAYIARTLRGFERMLRKAKELRQEKAAITAVVHGGTIMAVCSRLFGGDYFDYQIKCAEGFVCRFRYTEGGRAVLTEMKKLC